MDPMIDLVVVRDWLAGLTGIDMEDVVADGGVTAGMVVQQEASEMAGRMQRAIASLRIAAIHREQLTRPSLIPRRCGGGYGTGG